MMIILVFIEIILDFAGSGARRRALRRASGLQKHPQTYPHDGWP